MATNNFKAFGIAASANVTSQADYEALSALLTGFQSGKASSAQINKALRQSSTMAYVLAQFISDSASVDVLDNGTPATILANMKTAMKALTPGRLLNVQVFKTSGTYTPTPGTKRIIIEAQGGGGGGANAKSTATNTITLTCSGGAGGYVKHEIINPGTNYAYAVGAGGAADTKGGDTSIAGCVAVGGQPGVQVRNNLASNGQAISLGGEGGAASGGNILNTQGNAAGIAVFLNGPILCPGGSSVLGSGGRGAGATSSEGQPGSNGGGGGGATSSNATLQAGGKGGDGLIIVWEYA